MESKPTRSIVIRLDSGPDMEVGQCLLDLIHGCIEDNLPKTYFKYDRTEGCFLLSSRESRDFQPLPLLHSQSCPVRQLRLEFSLSQSISRKIRLCACVIVESNDEYILLTRRSEHMRVFPKAWVNPGGHVELGKNLEEEVLRELKEETGIVARPSDLQHLMLYESVFPTKLEYGMPSHQHLIVFFSLKLTSNYSDTHLKLQISEVDISCWLHRNDLVDILNGEDLDRDIEGIQASVKKDSRCVVNSLQLIGIAPNELGEGIGEGHYIGLKRYLGIR